MAFTIFMWCGFVIVIAAFLWAIWPLIEEVTGTPKKKSKSVPEPPVPTDYVLNLPFDPMEVAKRALTLYTSPVGYLWQLKYNKLSKGNSVVLWLHLYDSNKQATETPGVGVDLSETARLWEKSGKSKDYSKALQQELAERFTKFAFDKIKEKQIEVFEEGLPVYLI